MGTTAEKLQAVLDSKAAIKAAIENKGVENVGDVLSTYADKIASIKTEGSWTGHADVEGLKAIGWTDDDIAYYQEHGVNWNEEDDQYHLVPEDNKALYGVINASNISQYKDILVYCPKIDTSGMTDMSRLFYEFYSLVAVPLLDTSRATKAIYMFGRCYSLVSVQLSDTSRVTDMSGMFYYCQSLPVVPLLDMSSATNLNYTFGSCDSLVSVQLSDTSKVTNMSGMFYYCQSLVSVQLLNMSMVTSISDMIKDCFSLRHLNLYNLKKSIDVYSTSLLEKSSLLYTIENVVPTSAITITLSAYCYNKYSNDPDVVAALSAQPLVSLASAA